MAISRYEIYLITLKNTLLVHCMHSGDIFQHQKKECIYLHSHVISSMFIAVAESQFYKHHNDYY